MSWKSVKAGNKWLHPGESRLRERLPTGTPTREAGLPLENPGKLLQGILIKLHPI